MGEHASLKLRRLQGRLGDLVFELTRSHFSLCARAKAWTPSINAYRCSHRFILCVDLAGVDKEKIELNIEPRRLSIRGRREAPEPSADHENETLQVLAMEIDYGSFSRDVQLPTDIEPERATAEQRNGLLWIYLPLRPEC